MKSRVFAIPIHSDWLDVYDDDRFVPFDRRFRRPRETVAHAWRRFPRQEGETPGATYRAPAHLQVLLQVRQVLGGKRLQQLKEALNVVWEVKPKAGGGIWGFARNYVLSLAGVLTLGFLLLISMLLTAGLAAFARTFGSVVPVALMQVMGLGCLLPASAYCSP